MPAIAQLPPPFQNAFLFRAGKTKASQHDPALVRKHLMGWQGANGLVQIDKVNLHLCREGNGQTLDLGRDQFEDATAIVSAFQFRAQGRQRIDEATDKCVGGDFDRIR